MINKIKSTRIFAVAILGAFLPMLTFAAFSQTDWQYQKDISSYSGGDQYVAMLLDGEVFSGAVRGLADLRIIDSASQEVPYQLLVERSAREYDKVSSKLYNKISFDDETQFTLALSNKGDLHDRVSITTPSENFRREVIIEGSEDGEVWGVLTKGGFIFDVTVRQPNRIEFRKQETMVTYPETTVPFIRVRILDRGDAPLNISSASINLERRTQAQSVRYDATIVASETDVEAKNTEVVFDLGSAGLPTNSLTLKISGENFSRDVTLEGSNDKENWTNIVKRDVLFRFRTTKFSGERMNIRYGESSYRYLRVIVQNFDNPPLNITGASATGLLRRIVFPHDPDKTYRLYYGNPSAKYPLYDLSSYFRYLEVDNLREMTLGGETLNAAYVAPLIPEEVIPFTERFSWLLPSVFVIALILLGVLLRRVLASTKRSRG